MEYSIFIVEDEIIVALEIKSSIIKLGYICAGMATNYTDALSQIEKTQPDLVLLDITLKESKNGIAIANELRKTSNIPIIYLTSVSDRKMIQKAIVTAPISYLIKPFRREELQSSIMLAFYKNPPAIKPNLCDIGQGFCYDMRERLLFDASKTPVQLSPKERLLLDILIQAKESIVPFGTIESFLWGAETISSSSLRTLIYRLHKKLGCKLVETIPTFGCKMVICSV